MNRVHQLIVIDHALVIALQCCFCALVRHPAGLTPGHTPQFKVEDHRRSLGMVPLHGPAGWRLLESEVTLYRVNHARAHTII